MTLIKNKIDQLKCSKIIKIDRKNNLLLCRIQNVTFLSIFIKIKNLNNIKIADDYK